MATASPAVLKNPVASAVLKNSISLILVAAFFGVGGQIALKLAMNQIGRIGVDGFAEPVQILLRVGLSPLVWGGLFLYGMGAAVWMLVLSRTALSLAYPIFAVSYAITPVMAWLMLGETVNPARWIGIGVICCGVLLVSRT
jgi:multidrug transporter EmrE-like cation transporter